MRYSLSSPEISRVIVGVDSSDQLRSLVEAAGGPMPVPPSALQVHDCDLLNPSVWATL